VPLLTKYSHYRSRPGTGYCLAHDSAARGLRTHGGLPAPELWDVSSPAGPRLGDGWLPIVTLPTVLSLLQCDAPEQRSDDILQ